MAPVFSRLSQWKTPKMFISAPGGLRPQSVGADPTFNFVTNENDRHSEKTELQTSKRKEIDRPAAIPLSLCPFPPSRPRDLVIPHRNRLLIRLAPSFPIHPLAIKPFPPPNVGLRWALHIYKKKKAAPSLARLSFFRSHSLFNHPPPPPHIQRHTPCRPRLSPLALGRRTLRRSISPIPP